MKKLSLIGLTFLTSFQLTFATLNTHSIDLELSSNQCLSIADGTQNGVLDLSTDFTLEMWIKLESLPSVVGDMALITKRSAGEIAYFFNIAEGGAGVNRLYGYYSSDGGTTVTDGRDTDNTFGSETGVWHHIAVSADISASTFTFYLDGTARNTTMITQNATTIGNRTSPFDLGGYNICAGQNIDGKIDEIRVWNDIRTAQEISDNYQTELTGSEAGLVGYWQLDNNPNDSTANANNLTENNSPVYDVDVPFAGSESGGGGGTGTSATTTPLIDEFIWYFKTPITYIMGGFFILALLTGFWETIKIIRKWYNQNIW